MPERPAPVPTQPRTTEAGSGQHRAARPIEQTADWRRRVSWWLTAPAVVLDLTLAAIVMAGVLIFEATDAGEVGARLDPVDVVTCAIATAIILLRRRWPLPVLAIALPAAIWSMIPADGQGVLRIAAVLALYTVASTCDRRTAWTAGTVSAVALYVAAAIANRGSWYDGDNLELIAWAAVATAAGDAVRSRRAYTIARQERAAALQERAERAERALEEEARRQVVEERLRIARELHDVVAHHIAVINVQAGVATHLIHDQPDAAADALEHVRNGARSVLDELSGILDVMRQPDEPASSTAPLPTLDDLDRLVADYRNIGLDVEWHTSGTRQALAPTVDLAAYRIIQESLTNAHRHGIGDNASLRVDYRHDSLHIDIVNDIAPTAHDDTAHDDTAHHGHGLIGMRERVLATGGTIDIGTTADGRFHVHAHIPTHLTHPAERTEPSPP